VTEEAYGRHYTACCITLVLGLDVTIDGKGREREGMRGDGEGLLL